MKNFKNYAEKILFEGAINDALYSTRNAFLHKAKTAGFDEKHALRIWRHGKKRAKEYRNNLTIKAK
jgi:hypothetical protein